MHREFRDTVESLAMDAAPVAVTFVSSRGHYTVSPEPRELLEVLRASLETGRAVRVTCDVRSLLIVDAILD
jgi:hypothetical protein